MANHLHPESYQKRFTLKRAKATHLNIPNLKSEALITAVKCESLFRLFDNFCFNI